MRETKFDRDRLNIGTYCIDVYARDEEHVRQMKECGIDFLTAAPADPMLLDNCAKYGIGVVAAGILHGWWGGDGINVGQMASQVQLSSVREAAEKFAADPVLSSHPAIWGIDIGDEPSALDYAHYGRLIALAEELFPGRLIYLNLYPNYASVAQNTSEQVLSQLGTATYQEYIDRYVELVDTDYICLDNYEFSASAAQLYDNLRIVSRACIDSCRDFWIVLQVNSNKPEKWISADMLRHQAFSSLAFGAVSINWACWTAGWWHNQVLDSNGRKTEQYDKLKAVNSELRRLEPVYMAHRNARSLFLASAADTAIASSGCDCVQSFSNTAFTSVAPAGSERFALGEMKGRNSDSQAIFLADVTDIDFGSGAEERTLSFRLADGYSLGSCVSGRDSRLTCSDGLCTLTLKPYDAAIITAEK